MKLKGEEREEKGEDWRRDRKKKEEEDGKDCYNPSPSKMDALDQPLETPDNSDNC